VAIDAAVSLADKAIELFADRTSGAIRFHITDDNAAVTEICRRLDAMPLAIEPAAAQVRVLTASACWPAVLTRRGVDGTGRLRTAQN
jgi:predicted ATPase